ncbi:hypothetical protein BD410DRAFT_759142 [Rickenella mellea]|uniref:GRAM domain-containing protein n=1 Tax=Rickenella mellea TaxID=50990 RepID=A0A4R5XFQ2_9AGAM|nr:hypothetical protein BD410DRAFT_759142 [Rickenella mellea]
MALNWTMLQPNRTPVPLPHETTIQQIESGAEISLTIPDAPPSASSNAGGSGGVKRLKDFGGIWLTDQRLIFVTPNAPNKSFESLTIPLLSILSTSFEQPLLGSNYLTIDIKPSPDGGLSTGTKAELRLQDRGLFGFVSLLDKTRERAIYMKRQKESEEENLRESGLDTRWIMDNE